MRHVLEELQQRLHSELLQVCSYLLLLGDHAAGRKAPLGQWGAGCGWQQPHAPTTLGAPDRDTVLQMGPHEGRLGKNNHLPVPAGHPFSDGAQDTICFPSCKNTLLAHIKFITHQDPQVLLCRAIPKDCSSRSACMPGILLAQVQNVALCSLDSPGPTRQVC